MENQRIAKSSKMNLFERLIKNHPKRFGTFLALIGVLVLTPDTMVMRFSNLDQMATDGLARNFNGNYSIDYLAPFSFF